MITSTIQKTGPAPGARLAKAVGFALATLATSSAFALPTTFDANVPFASSPPFAAFFDLNGTTVKSASWGGQNGSGTGWTKYYAFQVVSPANGLSITASSTGSVIPNFSGDVFTSPACDPWGGAADYTLSCTSPGTWLSAMSVTTTGLRLDLPAVQPGYINITPPTIFLVAINGDGSQAYSVNVNTEVVPAPAALGLLGIGLVGMGLTRRRSGVAHTAAV
jgi:hypothetical protein